MTVKELIEKLQKCSPDAIVCAEVWANPGIEDVKEYIRGDTTLVYIGDDFENLTYELTEEADFEEV